MENACKALCGLRQAQSRKANRGPPRSTVCGPMLAPRRGPALTLRRRISHITDSCAGSSGPPKANLFLSRERRIGLENIWEAPAVEWEGPGQDALHGHSGRNWFPRCPNLVFGPFDPYEGSPQDGNHAVFYCRPMIRRGRAPLAGKFRGGRTAGWKIVRGRRLLGGVVYSQVFKSAFLTSFGATQPCQSGQVPKRIWADAQHFCLQGNMGQPEFSGSPHDGRKVALPSTRPTEWARAHTPGPLLGTWATQKGPENSGFPDLGT